MIGSTTLLRVTYLSLDPLDSTVGASQVLAYVRRLAERGVQVELHSFEHQLSGELAGDLAERGVDWRPHPYGRGGVLGGFWRVARLARAIQGAEIVHARSDMAAAAAMLAGADRWLWDVRSLWAEQKVATGVLRPGSIQERVFQRIERAAARRSGQVVTLTDGIVEVLDTRHGGVVGPKVTVVTTCVDRDRFVRVEPPPGRPLRLLLAGTLNRYYDVPAMLDLVHELRRRRPTELVVAAPGRTDWDEELESAGAVRVRASPDEMPGLIGSCHVGLSVCRDDAGVSLLGAMPTKIGEFLAVGRPVVVNSGLADAASMLVAAGAGAVHGSSEADPGGAADRLLDLVDDSATVERATDLAARHFDLDAGVDSLIGAYRRLQGKPDRAPELEGPSGTVIG
jgi:glycosyltransferase involved in cell wall biosynthesis